MDHSMHQMAGHMAPMPGHEGMDHSQPMCNMNMLFTWDSTNLCIIFRSWRVTGTMSLLWSLAAVAALTAGYELVREVSRRYEDSLTKQISSAPLDPHSERSSLLWSGSTVGADEQRGHVVKALLYGIQVFYSFFIMLLFMTYNGWIMLAVGFGAFLGYLMFGRSTITKSAACH